MICLNTQKQTLEYQNCSFILKDLLSSKRRDIHAEPNLVLTRSSQVTSKHSNTIVTVLLSNKDIVTNHPVCKNIGKLFKNQNFLIKLKNNFFLISFIILCLFFKNFNQIITLR